jgi:excisionase family DNA binding protein
MESMMTAREVAELLGVHENWVYDQAVAGDLPSYKIGGARRFRPDEIEAWLTAQRGAPPTAQVPPTSVPRSPRGRQQQPRLFEEEQ